ncbi:MAG: ribbon-helix-helix protein, CopG family [Verrucomicrobia bacterium]|nr:ribbon-helix-helix protein, CopG family [Verrucomicrobiota bacterium]
MAPMSVRTTVAFDPVSAARLERLAKRWGVSKSETLRRALAMSDNTQPAKAGKAPEFTDMTPLQILDWLAVNPQVPPGWGERHRRKLRELREVDARIEEERVNEQARTKVAEPNPPYSA